MQQVRKRGRVERFLFSFMGPPQLGTTSSAPPPAQVPGPPCPRCGRPYDEHQIVRTPRLTYPRCPDGASPNGGQG